METFNKIIMGTMICSTILSANLDVCSKKSNTICTEIESNIKLLDNQSLSKKKRLLTIAQLSRRVGILSVSDSNSIKNRLKKIPLFTSAITGKQIFMILASQCNNKSYIVEIGFDRNYNLDFFEHKYISVEKHDGALYLDNERFPLSDSVIMKYRNALQSLLDRKTLSIESRNTEVVSKPRKTKEVVSADTYMCVTANSGLKLRDPNNNNNILYIINKKNAVKIKSWEPVNRQGTNSYLSVYRGQEGYLAIKYLGECK